MKVFLSHSTKDGGFTQKLTALLRAENIEVWLCELDVEYGDNFVAKIEEGLRDADLTLLIWSPDAARSDWTRVEWTSVLAREIKESRARLGLIRLRDHPTPELLRTKDRIDAWNDPDAALREAVEWVKRLRDLRRSAESKAASIFLDARPSEFVGRVALLERPYAALANQPGGRFLLHGEPGAGKSTVALQFAWSFQGAFDAVVFQTCGPRSVEEITSRLAESPWPTSTGRSPLNALLLNFPPP